MFQNRDIIKGVGAPTPFLFGIKAMNGVFSPSTCLCTPSVKENPRSSSFLLKQTELLKAMNGVFSPSTCELFSILRRYAPAPFKRSPRGKPDYHENPIVTLASFSKEVDFGNAERRRIASNSADAPVICIKTNGILTEVFF